MRLMKFSSFFITLIIKNSSIRANDTPRSSVTSIRFPKSDSSSSGRSDQTVRPRNPRSQTSDSVTHIGYSEPSSSSSRRSDRTSTVRTSDSSSRNSDSVTHIGYPEPGSSSSRRSGSRTTQHNTPTPNLNQVTMKSSTPSQNREQPQSRSTIRPTIPASSPARRQAGNTVGLDTSTRPTRFLHDPVTPPQSSTSLPSTSANSRAGILVPPPNTINVFGEETTYPGSDGTRITHFHPTGWGYNNAQTAKSDSRNRGTKSSTNRDRRGG